MALIARHGHDWFRALGTRDEPGSGLFTVSGAVGRPGVYEAAFGSPLRALVAQAGGVRGEPGAFLVGGFFGSWIEPCTAQGLSLLDSELAQAGAGLGAGAIAVLPAAACGLDQSARVARYLADESAGQCGPCVHGLARARRCARGPRRRSRRQPAGRAALAAAGRRPGSMPAPGRGRSLHRELARSLCRRGRAAPARTLQWPAGRVPPDRPEQRVSRIVRVDPIACDGSGLCAELLPERDHARRLGLSDRGPRARCRPSSSSMPSGPSGPARSSRSSSEKHDLLEAAVTVLVACGGTSLPSRSTSSTSGGSPRG